MRFASLKSNNLDVERQQRTTMLTDAGRYIVTDMGETTDLTGRVQSVLDAENDKNPSELIPATDLSGRHRAPSSLSGLTDSHAKGTENLKRTDSPVLMSSTS